MAYNAQATNYFVQNLNLYFEKASTVRQWIEAGADVNAADKDGNTPLMKAEGNAEIIRILLAAGANVNARSSVGMSALLAAVWGYDQPEAVRLLIEAGADKNAKSDALERAARNGFAGAVRVLLEKGAGNYEARNNALLSAIEEDDTALRESITARLGPGMMPIPAGGLTGRTECVRLLIEAGANVNARTKGLFGMGSKSALELAWKKGNQAIIRMLMDAGARK